MYAGAFLSYLHFTPSNKQRILADAMTSKERIISFIILTSPLLKIEMALLNIPIAIL